MASRCDYRLVRWGVFKQLSRQSTNKAEALSFLIFIVVTISAVIVFVGARQMNRLDKRQSVILAVPIFAIFAVLAFLRLDNWLISDAIVLLVAIIGGSLIGTLLSHEGSIITFGVVASLVDIYSYSNGLTGSLIEAASTDPMILRYLMIHIPYESSVIGLVGIGDLYVIGTFYFALKSLGYSEIESVLVSVSGILIALVVGLAVGGIFGVPFITAPVILFLVYKSKEWRTQTSADSSSNIVQDEIE